MANYTINLVHHISTLTSLIKEYKSTGFLFKYNNIMYIISVHHFLPILKTILDATSEIIELNKLTNINWNELNIYQAPNEKYLLNTKIIKSYRTRFPEKNAIIKIEIGNDFERYEIVDYYNACLNPLSKLRSIYIKFFIGKIKDSERLNIINKFQELSGKPIFDKEDKLIGVFCKIIISPSFEVYGLVLPIIYLIKSLNKKDNESIYYLDIKEFDLKLGKYEIQKDDFNYSIYYPPTLSKIPLDIFVILEGDNDSKIMSKNTKTLVSKSLKFIKNENFDFNLKLETNEDGNFKLNTGFISTLLKSGYKKQATEIISKYFDCKERINDIYVSVLS